MPSSSLRCALVTIMLSVAVCSWAGGPRFVTGTGYATAGKVMSFYTSQPLYFTDPGTLSTSVTHAQADAMVAAAAAVWNIPIASLTLAQGGMLAEHVSGANAYFNGSSVVFPPDVMASNYLNIPIAVIYDTDGSVTDLLLGSGASNPSGCRQNGVTESVDGFGASGTIEHALLVLNGRCITSAPQSLTQMQYQVMRGFGRVLGLAWSQLNDNVFTGATQPTAAQVAYWPVMHPIDVVCGPYTYQCMQNPFSLRADDQSAMALLYPVTSANLTAGKMLSQTNGDSVEGWTYFSTGQGMDGLNVTIRRIPSGYNSAEPFQIVSGVSGVTFQENAGNPVSGAEPANQNSGVPWQLQEAQYTMGSVPISGSYSGLFIQPEAINPLYTGSYALAPYVRTPMTVAGTVPSDTSPFAQANTPQAFWIYMTDEPATCSPGNGSSNGEGTESAPAPADPSGFNPDLLCAVGHASWFSTTAKASRTWTIETTALDENGVATVQKAQPVIGVWNSADPTGTLPTVAAQAFSMNALALGVTQIRMSAATADTSYRFVVADQFGGGRPDFAYQARVFYADSVSPAVVSTTGGQIVVTGTGFRPGNEVLVNGVRCAVTSWTATQIVATAPSQAVAKAGSTAVDVEVLDPVTGATADIASALLYSGNSVASTAAQITVKSGAGQSVANGTALGPVVLLVGDGNGNPVAGATVTLYQTAYAWEGTCPALGPCAAAPVLQSHQSTLTSDANGLVTFTPLQVTGQPQTVQIVATAGTNGFVSFSLAVTP